MRGGELAELMQASDDSLMISSWVSRAVGAVLIFLFGFRQTGASLDTAFFSYTSPLSFKWTFKVGLVWNEAYDLHILQNPH